MISLLAAFQLAVAVTTPLPPKDSARLVARVREAEFQYIMDWRHEWETWRTALFETRRSLSDEVAKLPAPPTVKHPAGRIDYQEVIRYDVDQREWMAHLIASDVNRPHAVPGKWALVPGWVSPVDTEPADEALGIDNPLPPEYRDTVRARRARLLALLDSAAHLAPGDSWIVGQRVRMYVDQSEVASALRATTECRAPQWWCMVLRGYVRFTAHDAAGAAATFDTAVRRMLPATRCQWNDVSVLLAYTARTAYGQLTCAQQDSVNNRVWWLADPLYLVPTNDRKTEQYARRVLAELRAGNDVDEREDVRDSYKGPAEREVVLRYGWPTTMVWNPPPDCGLKMLKLGDWVVDGCTYPVPPGWSSLDTRDDYLGPTGWLYAPLTDPDVAQFDTRLAKGPAVGAGMPAPQSGVGTPAPTPVPWPARPLYWGPQYSTVPSWSAINDPLHAHALDWDLGPERQDTLVWDSSWWATEFYQRYEGPLVDLSTQIAFIRRHASAAIVAAMEWGVDPAILAPPAHAVAGVITSGGPNEKPHIVGAKMDGAHPRAILTPVESRPLLLGVEVVPANDSGAAGRTRFGIAPPPPLSALERGDIALSDVMLVRAAPGESFPTSIQEVLPRMYGSTTLVNPTRLAVFWEVYGQGDGDTVDVSLRIVRRNDAGGLARAAAAAGIGRAGDDTTTVRWREPRPGDPLAFAEGGVSVRPRGFALDVSALTAGSYALSVQVNRRDVSATSTPRELTIVRR